MQLNRLLNIQKSISNSFFLWGPRHVGKAFLLKYNYPSALYIDLYIDLLSKK